MVKKGLYLPSTIRHPPSTGFADLPWLRNHFRQAGAGNFN